MYAIKIMTADKYQPGDGEPCALAWGSEGWTILCRTPVELAPKPINKRAVALAKAREAKRLKRAKNG